MEKKCPECDTIIDRLDCDGTYSQMEYGTCSGSCDVEGNDVDMEINDTTSHEDYEDTIDEYTCPECGASLYLEDLLDVDEEDDDDCDNTIISDNTKATNLLINLIKEK